MLIIYSGISGSGKSTHSKKTGISTAVRLSSDELRAVIGKDENDQAVSGKVFQTMEYMTDYFLKEGRDVVIDATMVNAKARAPFVAIARKHKHKVKVIVMSTLIEEAKKRNANRDRKVPVFVIQAQANRFELPTSEEVDEIEIIN
jgi:protein phosphatase